MPTEGSRPGGAEPVPQVPLRVLVVHQGVLTREGEAGEVERQVYGLLHGQRRGRRAEVFVTDCRYLLQAVLRDDEVQHCRIGGLSWRRASASTSHTSTCPSRSPTS